MGASKFNLIQIKSQHLSGIINNFVTGLLNEIQVIILY